MKKHFLLLMVLSIITTGKLFAQREPEISITILSNDLITEVNLDNDQYIKNMADLLGLIKKEYNDYFSSNQKFALFITSHKSGSPSIKLYTNPQLSREKEALFLKTISTIPFTNTKLVDFPIVLSVNVAEGKIKDDFSNFISPTDSIKEQYEQAGLNKKYELNKSWAITEVLPVLSAFEMKVDDKFAGVKHFGIKISKTNFASPQNVETLTSNNSDYWRATMEMGIGNELIPATKIFMLLSQGKFDYANAYLQTTEIFAGSKTVAKLYLDELAWRLELFNKQLNSEIETGIKEHDKGNYSEALKIYQNILQKYPYSAWALYEQFYSKNALDISKKKIEPTDKTNWINAKAEIFRSNPLYKMDVVAGNAKESYLLFRRQEIGNLFTEKGELFNDIYKYGDISMDLSIYDYAAHLFWYSFVYSEGKNTQALNKFLYCIEKLGVTNLKENFKGDFGKEFKKIEENKEKEMKESKSYNLMSEK